MADYQLQFTGAEIDSRLEKAGTSVQPNGLKTVGGQSILGSGDIPIQAGDTNAVQYVAQELTEEQKAQARANINAASLADIQNIDFVTATTRPTASASTMGHIYLIGPDSDNNYERYYTQESNGTYSWVSLGSTKLDLSTYASKEEVSQLEAEVNALTEEITPVTPNADSFWDTSSATAVGGTYHPGGRGTYNGCYSFPAIEVNKGDKYSIKGNSNPNYFRGYVIVDGDWKITRLSGSGRIDESIVFEAGEKYIYINLWNYNSATDGVSKVKEYSIPDIDAKAKAAYNAVQVIPEIQNDIDGLENSSSELSADIQTISDKDVPTILFANRFYDTSGATAIGGTYAPSGSGSYNGCYCTRLTLEEGDRIRIKGNSNPAYFRGYVVTDADDKITRFAITSRVDEVITASATEKNLYVNLWLYNATTDGVWSIEMLSIAPIAEQIGTDYEDSWTVNSGSQLSRVIYGDFGGKCVEFELDTDSTQIKYALLYMYINGTMVDYIPFNIATGRKQQFRFPDGVGSIFIYNYRTLTANASFTLRYSFFGTMVDALYRRATPNDDLSDIKVVCFGDSITEFVDLTTFKAIPDYLLDISGATVLNAAIGGTQWRTRTTPVPNPTTTQEAYAALDLSELVHSWVNEDWTNVDAAVEFLAPGDSNGDQIKRLKANPVSDVNVVVIMMGTNDYINSQAVGTISDNDGSTAMGAMNKVITDLLTANPALHIYLFTNKVLFYNNVQTDANWCENYVNGQGVTLPQFNQKIKDIATKYNIPVCDMIETVGWNQINYPYYCPEGDLVHPHVNGGFRVLAERMWAFIRSNRTF